MTDPITVRTAIVADARGIAQVLVDGWKSTYENILPAEFLASFSYERHEASALELLQNLPASSAVFVADDGSSVVGVALARVSPETDYAAELDAIYVLPQMQRRGIGSQLLRHVVHWLTERRHASLRLWVLRDNPYRRFYERIGGELLREQQQNEFGGAPVVSVAYGWRDLATLGECLDARV